MASHLREVHCLVFAKMIDGNAFDELDAMQIISIFSCFTNVNVSDELKSFRPNTKDSQVKTIIEKIYTAKGLKATYKQTSDNQFQILSTTPLDKVITYEDDPAEPSLASASDEAVASAGEDTIIVPDIQPTGALDPFYTPGEQTRDGRWDYTKFTPGLERMFAPTEQMQKWY
jgi:hypothetical protein